MVGGNAMVETLICVAIGYVLGAIPSLMDKRTSRTIKPKEAPQMSFKIDDSVEVDTEANNLELQLENYLNYVGDGKGQKPLDKINT